MAESHTLGKKGEDIAADHLIKAGYKILFRNWKWGKNEIDLIAEQKDQVVFVEVKTRSENYQLHPIKSITNEKKKSIIWAADGYLQKFNINKESRFDIIILIKKEESYQIEHIEDAFYPTLR